MPRRPNATADEILMATMQLIAQHDVSGVSVDMIAEKTGVSKPTIYRRWPSRDDLIVAAMAVLEYPHMAPDTGSLRDDLTMLLDTLVEFLNRPDGGKVYASFLNAAIRNPKLAELSREVTRGARAQYERVIERAIQRGEIAPDVDIEVLVDALIAPFIYKRIAEDTLPRPENVGRILDLILPSISRQSVALELDSSSPLRRG